MYELSGLKKKRCLIIGGRQSAFEWTALLNEAGASAIHLSYRHDSPAFADSDWSWVNPLIEGMVDNPGWFRNLSPEAKEEVNHRFWIEGRLKLEPWLESRVTKDTIKIWPNTKVISCNEQLGGDILVGLDNGESLKVDHQLITRNSYPVLDEHLQTNIPNLYITSMAATQDFGPFFAFTVSVKTSAKLIGQAILK